MSQPSEAMVLPITPVSQVSCSSKWERVFLSYPTAWRAAIWPDWKSGSSDAAAGWRPKKPLRSSAPPAVPGEAIAIDWRSL